jgi:hypothetical protein
VAQCMISVSVFYFVRFNPFKYSSLSLCFLSPVFQQFSIHIIISSTLTSYGMWYYWCSVILFSFPSFPKYNRLVPLLHKYSTPEFACDHACSCIYVYLWIYLPHMRENILVLCIWSCLTSLSMISSNCIYLSSNPQVIILCGWVILHCV